VRSEPAVFHCFGCGVGGDVFKFAMLHERVSFPEAIELVAEALRPRGARAQRQRRSGSEGARGAAGPAWRRPRSTSRATCGRRQARLRARTCSAEGSRRRRSSASAPGAAREGWSDLLDALKRRFPIKALANAGLVLERQDHTGHYDRFRNRAVFPILNESGKVVAFGARSMDGSEPKYLNSPETPVYQKSRTLYGLSWAKDAARKEGRLVLMEGYLDVARALEHGVEEAVATCGRRSLPATRSSCGASRSAWS
jgi:DNA primase